MTTSGAGDDPHDPLWAVTKPVRPARPVVAAPVEDTAPVTAVPEAEPDPDLAATAALPRTSATPTATAATDTATDTATTATRDLDLDLQALGVTVDGLDLTVVDLPPVADRPPATAVEAPSLDEPVHVADDEPTAPVLATGFASDPLAATAVPEPRIDIRTEMIAMIPETGNTPILTSPLLDPTPPSGQRLRFRRRRSWRRRVLGLLGVLVVAAVGYFTISIFQVWSTGTTDHREPADVIAVLGAAQYDGRPSPQLRARLDQAVVLYEEGVAPVVFVTGGKREGDRFTEAEASRDYLVRAGVPAIAILMESEGSSTWESLQNMSGVLGPLEFDDVIIVTDPYHSLRAKLMAEELGMTAHVSPTRTSPVQGGAAFWRHVREAGGVAVGRIIGFSRLDRVLG
jgi:uncharacterized SAM-binding protein YcdF (DUF218 family)